MMWLGCTEGSPRWAEENIVWLLSSQEMGALEKEEQERNQADVTSNWRLLVQ